MESLWVGQYVWLFWHGLLWLSSASAFYFGGILCGEKEGKSLSWRGADHGTFVQLTPPLVTETALLPPQT